MRNNRPEASILVIFGAGGDLSWRKLIPALFNLHLNNWLPEKFAIIGVDLKPIELEKYLAHLRQGINNFSRSIHADDPDWQNFSAFIHYLSADFKESDTYTTLANQLKAVEQEWGVKANKIFYQATPPSLVKMIIEHLGQSGLLDDRERNRVVLEKPFGHDLVSAIKLNTVITNQLDESQIFRIDHFLGKETVQNILAFRFANALFEPIWDQRYIDHVQITVAETLGVEHRGEYYDQAGALRDMVQNHLMQLLCMIAMEPPVSFTDNEIRNKKVDVLHAIRPIPEDKLSSFAVRGQYDSGIIQDKAVPSYREEPDIKQDSTTESFAAIKLMIDNWRWQDVPFYLRTGKRMSEDVSEISIQFKPVPHQSFPPTSLEDWQPNRLLIHVQPNEGIQLSFQAKQPGPQMKLGPVNMRFTYQDAFHATIPNPYETLLLDVMQGDATLFMRADQVEAAWTVMDPILQGWESTNPDNFPNYEAGTWGPKAADELLKQDGRHWFIPCCFDPSEK
jgi:glucose-6-phosphate 1-dehydrogenase